MRWWEVNATRIPAVVSTNLSRPNHLVFATVAAPSKRHSIIQPRIYKYKKKVLYIHLSIYLTFYTTIESESC